MERVRMFTWLVLKSSLLMNEERWRRGMTNDKSFPMCGEDETVNHLFRECYLVETC